MDGVELHPFFGAGRTLGFALDYESGALQPRHCHDAPQLLHAARGVMRVTTPQGYWVVPPGRGVWIPAFVPHEIRMVGPVSMCTLYVRAADAPAAADRCGVVAVPPLLQRLMHELAAMGSPPMADARHQAIESLVLVELERLERLPLHVAMPGDARLRKLCEAMLARPDDGRSLDEMADAVGASARTLRRLFQRQLGMSFVDWRQQVRLMEALARLAEHQPVASVARDLGYAAPSAFIAMFKRSMGHSPRGYLREG
ncbi:MAG TPA: helix-turn-helix transcriptional regulator [Solimonas sp.]|nr:helix-turn-helix transcriptional regulator [Solimonas sp.]